MSDTPTAPAPETTSPAGGWFTPESRAVIGFTLAVFTLQGQTAWSTAVQALLFGSSFEGSRFPDVMFWWALAGAVVAATALLLGRRVVAEEAARWADHLARATIGLAALGLLLAVLTGIGALVNS